MAVIGIIVVITLLVLFIASYIMSNRIIAPKVLTNDVLMQRELAQKRLDLDFLNSVEQTKCSIISSNGCKLSVVILENEETKKAEYKDRVAVLCHGNKQAWLGMTVYAQMLMKLGFTCVMYDHRNHGESAKTPTTMGYYEKEDLKSIVDWCYLNFGQEIRVLTYGESMGAATVLCELEIDDRIFCTVSDCAYCDLRMLEKHLIKNSMHLPPFLFLPFARVIYKIRGKFDDRNVSPIKGALIAKSPILFIHGDKDTFVPTWMSVQMYEQRKGPKSLYLAKDAKHAMSCVIDRTLYEQKLTEFINQYYVKE